MHLNHPFRLETGEELYFRFYLMVPAGIPLDELYFFDSSSDEAFADQMAVDAGHLSNDTDLDNLKKDSANWDKFWKERVEGR